MQPRKRELAPIVHSGCIPGPERNTFFYALLAHDDEEKSFYFETLYPYHRIVARAVRQAGGEVWWREDIRYTVPGREKKDLPTQTLEVSRVYIIMPLEAAKQLLRPERALKAAGRTLVDPPPGLLPT